MSNTQFYYCKALNKFIALHPLLVSSRVLKAASKAGLSLEWDENGYISGLPFLETKKLLGALGSSMLSVYEFSLLINELKEDNKIKILQQVQSNKFTEWLNNSYEKDKDKIYAVENLSEETSEYGNISKKCLSGMPYGRPGWFDPFSSKCNKHGFPESISLDKDENTVLWKYWSVNNEDNTVAAMRGFVLSSGTCSLDLDIPIFAKHPKIMIRESLENIENIQEDDKHTLALFHMFEEYDKTLQKSINFQNPELFKAFFSNFTAKRDVIDNFYNYGTLPNEMKSHYIEEKIVDILGKNKAFYMAKNHGNALSSEEIEVRRSDLINLLTNSKKSIHDALDSNEKIVFVEGHKNPDADAVLSALFEALRRSVVYKDTVVPIINGTIPEEVRHILGEEICGNFLFKNSRTYNKAVASGLVRWVLVDWNEFDKPQFVDSVIDHHQFKKSFPYYVAVTNELNWSTTLQVYNKIMGSNIRLDQQLAHMLLAGTLLEAEYGLMKKVMCYSDQLVYQNLLLASKCDDDQELYTSCMQVLLKEQPPELLFNRDYKQSHPLLGFSVVKQSEFYSEKGDCLKPEILQSIIEEAQQNNLTNSLPLTLIKVVDYEQNAINVNCEEIVFVFNDAWFDKGFRNAIKKVILKTFEVYHNNSAAQILSTDQSVRVIKPQVQLPRLILSPLLMPLIDEQGKFFYSSSLKAYVSRGFYDGCKKAYKESYSNKFRGKWHNHISFFDMKILLKGCLNTKVLTLEEYWQVYGEASNQSDHNMLKSLRDSNFVELLDTYIYNKEYLINNVSKGSVVTDVDIDGMEKTSFLKAHPGLIKPLEIDKSGLPNRIYSPDNYGDKSLWRYWSPDTTHSVACRGHIFLLNQTSLDLKIPPHEKHENMGFRPVYKDIPDIVYSLQETENWLELNILPRAYGAY